MFKFLFRGNKNSVEAVKETQRQTFERALGELNELLALMDPKPKVTIDPGTGFVDFELPEQMPDEALALPSPEDETEEAAKTEEADAAKTEAAEADTAEAAQKEEAPEPSDAPEKA